MDLEDQENAHVCTFCKYVSDRGRAFAGSWKVDGASLGSGRLNGHWSIGHRPGLGSIYIYGTVHPILVYLELNLLSGIYTKTLDPDKPDKKTLSYSLIYQAPPRPSPSRREEGKYPFFFFGYN